MSLAGKTVPRAGMFLDLALWQKKALSFNHHVAVPRHTRNASTWVLFDDATLLSVIVGFVALSRTTTPNWKSLSYTVFCVFWILRFHGNRLFFIRSGEGNRDEIVIEAVPYDDLFVNVCGADVALVNLTFVQVSPDVCVCVRELEGFAAMSEWFILAVDIEIRAVGICFWRKTIPFDGSYSLLLRRRCFFEAHVKRAAWVTWRPALKNTLLSLPTNAYVEQT